MTRDTEERLHGELESLRQEHSKEKAKVHEEMELQVSQQRLDSLMRELNDISAWLHARLCRRLNC